MKIAITGATGFIGGKLAEKLLSEGHEIRCLVRNPDKADRLKTLDAEIFYGNLADLNSLHGFLDGIEVIYHIAAYVSDWGKKEDFYRINVEATRVLLDQSVKFGVKRFIHMSSSTVVWRSSLTEIHDLRDIDESFPYPETHYDNYNETKEISEKLVLDYNNSNGLETVVIRPSNVWGDGDNVILPRLVEAARKGILYPIGYNKKTVTPCNVHNLVHALILSSKTPQAAGNIYFINDGVKLDYFKFISDQLDTCGIRWTPGIVIPYILMYIFAAILEFAHKMINSSQPPILTRFAVSALAGSRSYSILKARKELGYDPPVDYSKGMKMLRNWTSSEHHTCI